MGFASLCSENSFGHFTFHIGFDEVEIPTHDMSRTGGHDHTMGR
jgi:hypothetical protein